MKDNRNLSGGAEAKFYGKPGNVYWLTGLSGSGKSTIASALSEKFHSWGIKSIILDGDIIRKGLCDDLGFILEERKENIRRVAHVSKIFSDNGINVIAAFICPIKEDRILAKSIIGDTYNEVYIKCSVEECENRDPKGLYKKARSGEIPNFTGISSPFDEPENSDIVIDTEYESLKECVVKLFWFGREIEFSMGAGI